MASETCQGNLSRGHAAPMRMGNQRRGMRAIRGMGMALIVLLAACHGTPTTPRPTPSRPAAGSPGASGGPGASEGPGAIASAASGAVSPAGGGSTAPVQAATLTGVVSAPAELVSNNGANVIGNN